MDIYEDLKMLLIESGFVADDEVCGYNEYQFTVRKAFLLQYLNSIADHEITEDSMNDWLRNEYTSDDSYQLYREAKILGEVVSEGPVWQNEMTFFEVKEVVIDGNDVEEEKIIYTMDYGDAREAFDARRDLTKRAIIAKQFFIRSDGRQSTDIISTKDDMLLAYWNDENQRYTLTLKAIKVER